MVEVASPSSILHTRTHTAGPRFDATSRPGDAPQLMRAEGVVTEAHWGITFLLKRRGVPPDRHCKHDNLPGVADCGCVSPRHGRLEIVDDGSVQAVGCS